MIAGFSPSCVRIWYKHVILQTWSHNILHSLVGFKHTETIKVSPDNLSFVSSLSFFCSGEGCNLNQGDKLTASP